MGKNAIISIVGLSGQSIFMEVEHFHNKGETLHAKSIHIEAGGKGYNQAVAVSRLGADAHFLTAIADDENGLLCEKTLHAENVNSYFVKNEGAVTAVATILTDKLGNNQVTVFKGERTMLSRDDIHRFAYIIKQSDILLLQLEIPLDALEEAIEIAYINNIKVILNPAPVVKLDKALFKKVFIITPNEIEFEQLFGLKVDSLKEITDINNIIVTRGDKGALVKIGKEIYEIPPKKVIATDTTGAGDVFNAALAVKIAEGLDIISAASYANIVASESVTKKYVINSIPTKDAIGEEIYKCNKDKGK